MANIEQQLSQRLLAAQSRWAALDEALISLNYPVNRGYGRENGWHEVKSERERAWHEFEHLQQEYSHSRLAKARRRNQPWVR